MMSENKKTVPIRRFQEFKNSNAWVQRKLGEVSIIRTGYPFDSNQFDDSGEYLVITNGNIQDNSATVDNSLGNHISIYDYNILREYLLNIDDILVTMDGTVGRTAKVAEKGQILAQRVGRITANEDAEFLYQWLNTGSFSKAMSELSHGGTIKHISLDAIRSFTSLIPESIEEKKKIGAFFRNLDNLITLHQRKLEKMKALKSAYLSEMFPADGECKPKRRFKGFTNVWEQHKLGGVASFSKGNGYSKSDLRDAGTPIILYGRLYTKYETSISEVDTFANAKNGSVYSKGGEVIIPASGETAEDIARAATVENAGILLGGDLNIITPDSSIDSVFLALSISNGKPQKELAKKAQGKSVVHIHNDEIKDLIISFPKRDEQKQISTYFANLDKLITLHQLKLDKLHNIKTAYLNEMFIGGER